MQQKLPQEIHHCLPLSHIESQALLQIGQDPSGLDTWALSLLSIPVLEGKQNWWKNLELTRPSLAARRKLEVIQDQTEKYCLK